MWFIVGATMRMRMVVYRMRMRIAMRRIRIRMSVPVWKSNKSAYSTGTCPQGGAEGNKPQQ